MKANKTLKAVAVVPISIIHKINVKERMTKHLITQTNGITSLLNKAKVKLTTLSKLIGTQQVTILMDREELTMIKTKILIQIEKIS